MIAFVILCCVHLCSGQVTLPGYNVESGSWSVSGISSGACMATQLHVAYADEVNGVGMVAGAPYYCGENSATQSLRCMDTPQSTDVASLIQQAIDYGSGGDNAPTSNINGDKVFIFQGTVDTVVYPENGQNVLEFYQSFGADIQTEFTIAAEHGFPTDSYGGPCGSQDPEYINNCNYHGAFEILNYIYGGLTRPSGFVPLNGDFYVFDQRDFFTVSLPGSWSVDNEGFVYAPPACVQGQECKLHMVLHGCEQAAEVLGETFARETGYLEVAELNNIIMIFPQAIASFVSPVNGFGCWDWWGYNTFLYATQDGGQTLALWRMLRQASGMPW